MKSKMTTAPEPLALHDRAIDDLRFIRGAMERAGSFTAVPGGGGIVMGLIALAAAPVAATRATPWEWMTSWLAAATLACAAGTAAAWRKARRSQSPLLSAPGRKFVLGLTPPLLAGLLLTAVLARAGVFEFLPGLWLLLYGAGVVACGVSSIAVVPAMGACFMAAGAAALFAPPSWADPLLAGGFGVLHIAFGILIKVKHGG